MELFLYLNETIKKYSVIYEYFTEFKFNAKFNYKITFKGNLNIKKFIKEKCFVLHI